MSLVCRCSAFTDVSGVFHEEAVDQHHARKRLHGRLHLPLLPGERPQRQLSENVHTKYKYQERVFETLSSFETNCVLPGNWARGDTSPPVIVNSFPMEFEIGASKFKKIKAHLLSMQCLNSGCLHSTGAAQVSARLPQVFEGGGAPAGGAHLQGEV